MSSIDGNVEKMIISGDAESVTSNSIENTERQSSGTQMQTSHRRPLFRRSTRIRERRMTESTEVRLKCLDTDAERHRLREIG